MKKKLIYILITLIILVGLISLTIILINKKSNSLVNAIMEKNNTKSNNYKRVKSLKVLNENSNFKNYVFTSNNSIYIFNPDELDNGNFIYEKIYDAPKDIEIMNLLPGEGTGIKFIDTNDNLYILENENSNDNDKINYDTYKNAKYKLSNYKQKYSTNYLGKETNYDFMSEYVYSSNNVIYRKLYNENEKYPTSEEVKGNYKGEKVLRIYNERIVKTNKSFYEIMTYYDSDTKKDETILVKIKLLTEHYDEILTFTYKYVILKNYTIIPINDVMKNKPGFYISNYFLSSFKNMKEVRYEE